MRGSHTPQQWSGTISFLPCHEDDKRRKDSEVEMPNEMSY